ncbi:MAG: GntR family transcriptional regulator [Deferrisomatales bacterium]
MTADSPFRMTLKRPVSVRDQVHDQLRAAILEGRFPPGTRLVEARLAAEIGASRTPVREALHTLEREGLLEAIPRVGYAVRGIRRGEVEEICAIRAVNEKLAADWAAERATPEELAALEANLAAAAAEVGAGRTEAFVELDAEFHEILVRASRSERLVELCQTLRRHMLLYRVESIHTPENALRAIEAHRRIVECLRARDRAGLARAVDTHLEQVKRDVLRYAFEEPRKKKPPEVKDA